MSKPDKRYYKINIHGQEQVFTNVEKVDKGYIANGVDKDGKAYEFYHRLSQEHIDSAIISNSMVFVEKPTDVVFRFYLVNASEYDNGNKETSGIWLDFPAGIKHIENAFEEIGLPPDAKQGEYFIYECQCILKCLNPLVNVNTSIHELARTAERLDTFDGFQMMKLDAIMQTTARFNSLEEVREFTYNVDYYDFELDITDTTQLGLYCIYESGVFENLPDYYKDAINAESFGKYLAEAEHGVFTQKGYLYPSGDEWEVVEMPFFRPNSLKPGIDDKLIDTTEIFGVDLDSFFREISDEYSNMRDDVIRAQKHIASCIRTDNTAEIKQMIYGMQHEYYLSDEDVRPYINRLENFEKLKGIANFQPSAEVKRSIKKQLEENKGKVADVPAAPAKNKKNDLEV